MPRVRVKDGDREEVREILGQVLTFGRAPDNHIILTDRECSRHHCYIEKVERGFKLVDLESRNGTKANGQFRNQHLLQTNDLITIGKAEIVFIDENAPAPAPRPAGAAEGDRTTGVVAGVKQRIPAPPTARTAPVPAQAPAQKGEGGATVQAPASPSRRQDRRERMRRMQHEQEKKTLTMVFCFAGFFILALLGVFFYFLLSGEKRDDQYSRDLFAAAEKAERDAAATEDPGRKAILYEEAVRQYGLVPSSAASYHKAAQRKVVELGEAARQARGEALARRVQAEMADIDAYLKSRQPPDTFGTLNRYERLLQTVPADHPLRAEILKRMEQVRALREGV